MRFLQLDDHLIPVINIHYVSRGTEEHRENEHDTDPVVYETVVFHFRNGSKVVTYDDFDEVCAKLAVK